MCRSRQYVGLLIVVFCACGGGAETTVSSVPAGRITSDLSAEIDPSARYLFYLHGRIIEEEGVRPTHPEFGAYEYEAILQALAAPGFVVVSEARPPGTEVAAYADKVAAQVSALLAAGVPPESCQVSQSHNR